MTNEPKPRQPSRMLRSILRDMAAQMAVEGFDFFTFDCGDNVYILDPNQVSNLKGQPHGQDFVSSSFSVPIVSHYVNSANEVFE